VFYFTCNHDINLRGIIHLVSPATRLMTVAADCVHDAGKLHVRTHL